jgi:hypothetical protein
MSVDCVIISPLCFIIVKIKIFAPINTSSMYYNEEVDMETLTYMERRIIHDLMDIK